MNKESMARDQAQALLMAYATQWLATWSGQAAALPLDGLPADTGALDPYRALLAGDRTATPPGEPLLSIFSRIKQEDGPDPPQVYWPAVPLSLKTPAYPVARDEARPAPGLWDEFRAEWDGIRDLAAGMRFEAFAHLLHKWAWAVPCRYGEPGVSLYDEFRALSALVHASGCALEPAGTFQLVGGDIPGIQDFVYTITSKGAAKGLRGRSFFIQLLGDAVVRRLLAELDLPETNVIYAAGGNFMLLAHDGPEVAEAVKRVERRLNSRLVEAIQGDTALVLEHMMVPREDLLTPGRSATAREAFSGRIARAKGQSLREFVDDWALLFEPKGKGSELSCAVCRIEVDEHNSRWLEPTGEIAGAEAGGTHHPRICHLCASFGELAREIRHDRLWLEIVEAPDGWDTQVQPGDGWAQLLERMTGFTYRIRDRQPERRECTLVLNQPGFLGAGACGFRLLANVTPTTTTEDIAHLRANLGEDEPDLPGVGEIRSFALLARAATLSGAIERVGVLRMDVDWLSRVVAEGIPGITLPALGALSGLVEQFFSGYLDTLVRGQSANDLYTIYAGGDDLFVVGAWHHLPELAETIHDRFCDFAGRNPALSLSGGITLEGARFPLYRAAERAGEAEGKAKAHSRPDGRGKDALCFLDTVVGWEDWDLVRRQKDELLWLVGKDAENRAMPGDQRQRRLPRRLLHMVQSIHNLYRSGLQDARRRVRVANRGRPEDKKLPLPRSQMFFGRWTWMRVYAMGRLADRSKRRVPEAPPRIEQLQQEIMNPATVRYSGLSARWVEYLVRSSGRDEGN